MKQLPWDNNPEIILTIFLHIVAHYWKAENNPEYYRSNSFPRHVSDVVLTTDHTLYRKPRLHLYEIKKKEYVGVWDESIYHIGFASVGKTCLDSGDYRHDFQLFLKSFLTHIAPFTHYYPLLKDLFEIVSHFPLLSWKCLVCQNWIKTCSSSEDNALVRCLLSYKNKKTNTDTPKEQAPSFVLLLQKILARLLPELKKILEQTSADPILIIEKLIDIVEKYTSTYSIDQADEFETQCARDMKNYLYQEFKFLQTKKISIHHFPRDMIMTRDIFSILADIWSDPISSQSSPGIMMLLCTMHFRDRVLENDLTNLQPHVLITDVVRRPMTEQEKIELSNYHPLLRHAIFVE